MKSPCHDMELLLTEYAAGELPAPDRDTVAEHLAICANCRSELQRELTLRDLLGSLPLQQASPPVQPGAYPANHRTATPASRLQRWLSASAGIAAVLVLVLLAGRFSPGTPGAVEPATRSAAPTAEWTAEEIEEAQQEIAYSLQLTARLLKKGERTGFHQVFGEKLPRVLSDSLRKSFHTNQGDQG